jgi:hypothetical protein
MQGNRWKRDLPTRFATAWSLLGLGWEKMETLFAVTGGVCPLSNSQFAVLNDDVLRPAISCLTTTSCHTVLAKMQERGLMDFATDATYSSRNWHANEITVLLSDAHSKKIAGRKHLLKDTGMYIE